MAFALPALSAALPYLQSAAIGAGMDAAVKYATKKLHLKKGGKVNKPFNKKPVYMEVGGRVRAKRGMTGWQNRNDSVHALLQPGEVVIPKYYQKNKKKIELVSKVAKFLKKNQINLPGM